MNNLQKELTEHVDDSGIRFDSLGKEIQIIRSDHVTEVGECRRASDGLDRRLSKLEGVCGRLDTFSDGLERIKEGLSRHVSGLWSCVNGLNVTVVSHGDLIDNIQNVQLENVHTEIHRLNSSVVDLAEEFHSFVEQDFMGKFEKLDIGGMGFDFWKGDSTQLKGDKVRMRGGEIEQRRNPSCYLHPQAFA